MARERIALPVSPFSGGALEARQMERVIMRIPGVSRATANVEMEMLYVEYDPAACQPGTLIAASATALQHAGPVAGVSPTDPSRCAIDPGAPAGRPDEVPGDELVRKLVVRVLAVVLAFAVAGIAAATAARLRAMQLALAGFTLLLCVALLRVRAPRSSGQNPANDDPARPVGPRDADLA